MRAEKLTKAKAIVFLKEIGVNPYTINETEKARDFAMNMVNVEGLWEVYYYERGEKLALRVFKDEPIAAMYFLKSVLYTYEPST